MAVINHQFRLAARPVGLPKRSDWTYTEEPAPELGAGELLVKVLYISLDPAMRGWMNEGKSYIPPVGIGEVMRAGAVGRVIASNNPAFTIGAYVSGGFGVQEYAVSDGRGVTLIDPAAAPLPVYLRRWACPASRPISACSTSAARDRARPSLFRARPGRWARSWGR